jgi:hypothetical protein
VITHFDAVVSQTFLTRSSESVWDCMSDKTAFSTLLLLRLSGSAQSSSVLHWVRLADFMLYRVRLPFSQSVCLMLPTTDCL